jgi:hypothetical protein
MTVGGAAFNKINLLHWPHFSERGWLKGEPGIEPVWRSPAREARVYIHINDHTAQSIDD